jgi:hypothetical protein
MKIVEIKDEAFHVDDEVAEYIKGLEAELEKHQWVSVEERLPEGDTGPGDIHVATYHRYGNWGQAWFKIGINKCWWVDSNNLSISTPTHWKSIILPSPETAEI